MTETKKTKKKTAIQLFISEEERKVMDACIAKLQAENPYAKITRCSFIRHLIAETLK